MDEISAHDKLQHPDTGTGEAALHTGDTDSITDLGDALDLTAEQHVAASLQSALQQLRSNADSLAAMPVDEGRIEAAERIAEDAAAIDEEIGSISRSEDA